jgi:aryl-alcohol dehydrogenase
MYCGTCDNCQNGRFGYCYNFYGLNLSGSRQDGSTTLHKDGEGIHGSFFGQSSFATFALASEKNVVKVREDIPLDILGPLGCGIQTGAGGVINALAPHAGSSIAVFGTGSVGLSAIMAARVVGCTTIIGIDIRPDRLKFASELGATQGCGLPLFHRSLWADRCRSSGYRGQHRYEHHSLRTYSPRDR